jgi:hypothetical protein
MKPEVTCDEILAELLADNPPVGEAAHHISRCPDCRIVRKNLKMLGAAKTAFPEPPSLEEKNRLFRKLAERYPSPSSSSSGVGFPATWMPIVMLGVLVFSLLAGSKAGWFSRVPAQPVPAQNGYLLSVDEGPAVAMPLRQVLTLAEGQARSSLPDGSIVEITGPASLGMRQRGLDANFGQFRVWVAPAGPPFVAGTPFGAVESTGSVFQCDVSSDSCKIHVISGVVRVIQMPGNPTEVTAGNSAQLVATGAVRPGESSFRIIPSEGN